MKRYFGFLLAFAVAWWAPNAIAAPGTLYVANGGGNSVLTFAIPTGGPSNVLIPNGTGGLQNTRGITFGPGGDLFVTSQGTTGAGEVLRYNSSTGAFLGVFATTADTDPFGLRFGPDGSLYVANILSNSVSRFSSSGTLLGTFVPGGSGGLFAPRDLIFNSEGDLLVSSLSGSVLRYSGSTGAFEGVFAANVDPRGLTFGPGGDLFVASFGTNDVRRFNGVTGANEGTFASGGGLLGPVGLAFGPDGDLYVSAFTNGEVLRYSPTGAFVDIFESGGGLSSPRLMAVAAIPEPNELLLLTAGIAALAIFARRRRPARC
jgi:streptogramin lyase